MARNLASLARIAKNKKSPPLTRAGILVVGELYFEARIVPRAVAGASFFATLAPLAQQAVFSPQAEADLALTLVFAAVSQVLLLLLDFSPACAAEANAKAATVRTNISFFILVTERCYWLLVMGLFITHSDGGVNLSFKILLV